MNCLGFNKSGGVCGRMRSSANPFFCGGCSSKHGVQACFLPQLDGKNGGHRVLILQNEDGETASCSWPPESPSWPSSAARMHPSQLIEEVFGDIVDKPKNMWPVFLLNDKDGEAHYTHVSKRGAKGWNNRVPSVTFPGYPVGDVAAALAAGVAPVPGTIAKKALAGMKKNTRGGARVKRPLDVASEEDSEPVSKKPTPSREEFEHVSTEVARIAKELLRMGNAKDDRETKNRDALIKKMNEAKGDVNTRLEKLETRVTNLGDEQMAFEEKLDTIDDDLECKGETLDKCMRNLKTMNNNLSELKTDLSDLQELVH